jgi:2-keto-4-pentenoate hydratase/2-oxohepta-3-ene-1,7-dioic acid hydratase in catechol pathway/FixJ family two-component response regulator
MRIIRFLSNEGRSILGEENGDGTARVLLDAAGVLGPAQTQQATREVLRGKRAVVADDDDGILKTVEAALSRFECTCHVCHDGDEALDAIEHETVDLVVSDIVMPGHDGYEVFAAAKQRDPDLPVVLITGFGYDPSHQVVRASQQGLEGVLFKPFTPRQLVDRVTEAMIHHEALVPTDERVPLGAPLAPITPRDVVCAYPAAGNGEGHLELFLKPSTAVQDPGKPVRLPATVAEEGGPLHVECRGRLAVVLSTKISRASPEEALRAVLGYTVANDVTARRAPGGGARNGSHRSAWLSGKGFDTFCPLGPAIVTPGQATTRGVRVRTVLNGTEVAVSEIEELNQFVGELLSRLSHQMTLAKGAVILTGPADHGPAAFSLKPGDLVRIEAEGIGALENRIST